MSWRFRRGPSGRRWSGGRAWAKTRATSWPAGSPSSADTTRTTSCCPGPTPKPGRNGEKHPVRAAPPGGAPHATVRIEPIGVVLEDEGSLNGTFVNGERVAQRLLGEGDRVPGGPRMV